MWRFLLFGHDGVAVPRLIAAEARSLGRSRNQHRTTLQLFKRWTVQSTAKLIEHFRRQPSRVLSLPIVAPVIVGAVIFQAAGAVAGLLAPKRLLEAMPDDLLPTDFVLEPGHPSFPITGLKRRSVLSMHKLALLHKVLVLRVLGEGDPSLMDEVDQRLRVALGL